MAPLQFEEFAERVAKISWSRYRVKVSPRLIRKWSFQKIVPSPTKKGLGRGGGFSADWNCGAYRAALKICRHTQRGARRIHTYRVVLWLWGAPIEFDHLQPSLRKEVKRLRSRVLKDRRSTKSPLEPLDSRQRRSLLRVFKVGDPRLETQIDDEQSQLAMLALVEGLKASIDLKSVFGPLVEQLPEEGMEKAGSIMVSIFSGILGDPDMVEGSGLEKAHDATLSQLETARHHFQAVMNSVAKTARIAKLLENDPRALQLPIANEIQIANAKLKSPEMQIILFWQVLNGTINNPAAWEANPAFDLR